MPVFCNVLSTVWPLFQDRRAVTSLEYGIISVALIVVGLASLSTVGTRVQTKMNTVKVAMT